MTIFSDARLRSVKIISDFGYEVSSSLPRLDGGKIMRSSEAFSGRLLSLHGIVSLSFGWDQRHIPVKNWLNNEKLIGDLTSLESDFLSGEVELTLNMQWRIEALFGLAWACELTDSSLLDPVPDNFVQLFPSISKPAPVAEFREHISPRSADEIICGLDLLYCLASAKTDRYVRGEVDAEGSTPNLSAVQQRRQALEWLLSDSQWEDIELDT